MLWILGSEGKVRIKWNKRLKLKGTHVIIRHRFLQPSSGHGKFKLYPKALASVKIQLSGLCPLGPLSISWADASSLHLCSCTEQTTLSLQRSEHQFGRESPPEVWASGLQGPSFELLASFVSSCFFPALVNVRDTSAPSCYWLAF